VLDQLKAAPGQDYNKLLVDSVINFNHNLQLMTDAEGVDALFVSSLLGKHLGSVTEKVKQVYLGFTLNDELVNTLAEMAVRSLLKKQVGTNFSGVVIAGFGEAEQFPRCYNLIVKQIVENKLIWFKDEELEISLTNNSSIIPFAQTDIAQTFIRGIDPNIETDINNQSQILIRKWEEALSLIPPLADNQANHFQQLRDVIVNHVAATKRIIDVKKWSTITKPLLNGIASSNLAELATMAETLINLTSFRLKFTSNVTETVGGPIDVAVISKGDGFIWVKRKHYFEKEYNFHFFQNYFREIKEEDA
jgi:cyanate lyase